MGNVTHDLKIIDNIECMYPQRAKKTEKCTKLSSALN